MVKKIANYITKYCYVVFVVFLVLAGICGLLATKVNINHDIYSYMPANSETSVGLNIMKDEFDYGSTSSWQMMIEDMPEGERTDAKSYIESVEHIKSVAHDDSDSYVREHDGHTYSLYDITLNAAADSEIANKTYKEIDAHFKTLGHKIYYGGEVASSNGEVVSIMIVVGAIGTAMIILTIMSESFIEPWLFLFAIMVAVLLNKGTNIMFDNVSFITDSIAMVLQMALSMDYAIMLSSRFRQEKAGKDHPDKHTAMSRALRYSFGAILSSSFTTIVGLIILVFMSFTIGRDMGLVLSKGVLLSLISIFTILPALLLFFNKAIEKTHKKCLHLRLGWLAKGEFRFRKLAMPLFALIFIGAFLLKGNTGILFTGSENNFVKDVFPAVNQTALVYDTDKEETVAKFCDDFDQRDDTKRVICYSNTIGEQEKYNKIVAHANELSGLTISGQGAGVKKQIEVEDYLVKTIYYYYYRGDKNTMNLVELVKFLQNEVLDNENFSDVVTNTTRNSINRLAKFILPEEASKARSREELAEILEVDPSMLDDLYVLYLSKQSSNLRLSINQFARFVNDEVLTNPNYSSMISADQRYKVSKALLLSDPNVTNSAKNAKELAEIFGLDQADIEKVIQYHNYLASSEPTVALTPEQLFDFILTNDMIRSELPITAEQAQIILDKAEQAKETLTPYLEQIPTVKAVIDKYNHAYQYDDFAALHDYLQSKKEQIKTEIEAINTQYGLNLSLDMLPVAELENYLQSLAGKTIPGTEYIVPEINLANFTPESLLAKLKQVYQVYQMGTLPNTMTPKDLVYFLVDHANDEVLGLSKDKIELLNLVKYVIDHQNVWYSCGELASTFSLNGSDLSLVYALYDYRYVTDDPMLSLETLIQFLTDQVFTDARFSSRLDTEKKDKISTIAGLMRAARVGTQYDYNSLYTALSPLSNSLDINQIFLVYLYHGSLYDYSDEWTLSIEQFVDFLNDSIITDSRFEARVSDTRRQDILDAKVTVADAKALLVGPDHSRALIEADLPAEGEATFGLLKAAKDYLGGTGKDTGYYLVGDSAMAYEMSQSFGGEMDFITILTMASIFIVVALTFKSILLPLVLVLVIQAAVYITMSYLSITGQSIYFIALIIVQAILMGATIDYAILFASYYIEQRKYHDEGVLKALGSAYNKSIHSILTSASILILVTAIVGNFASAIAAKICQSISVGSFVATLIILFILPALLASIDKFIVKKKK